jgi:hypothetical protein
MIEMSAARTALTETTARVRLTTRAWDRPRTRANLQPALDSPPPPAHDDLDIAE